VREIAGHQILGGAGEGDLEEGELEIGQVSGLLRDVPPAGDVLLRMVREYEEARARLASMPALG